MKSSRIIAIGCGILAAALLVLFLSGCVSMVGVVNPETSDYAGRVWYQKEW